MHHMWHSGHRMSAAARDKLIGNVEVRGAPQAGLPRLAAAGNVSILSSTNNDSAAAAVATTQAPEEAADWFLQYTAIYIIPLWIVLGVLNNVSVLCVMPRKGVLVPKRMKRLYIGIAFGDLITILAQDLVYFYLEQGLYFTTNGAYWLPVLSVWTCKIEYLAWMLTVMVPTYLMAYLAIERTIAIMWPLFAKRYLTERVSLYVPLSVVLVLNVIHVPFVFLLETMLPQEKGPGLCTVSSETVQAYPVAYEFWIWYGCVTVFIAHAVITFVCSLLISSQLAANWHRRGHMVVPGAQESSGTSKELQASVTVLILAIMQCLVYFPSAVGCMLYCFVAYYPDLSTTQPYYYETVMNFYKFTHVYFTVAHVWNMYVYLVKIPSFRQEYFRLISCGHWSPDTGKAFLIAPTKSHSGSGQH